MTKDSLAVLILAGGKSQRMGQDKALLELGGIPLLLRTWEIAQTLTPAVWVVTSQRDLYQSVLPDNAQWILEIPPAPDRVLPGPLVAFTNALTYIEATWILLLACDMPALQAD
ncbi:MAG: NTP transferase domain-containing protein, partial [Leptolyngbya sp. SIO1D8]|nr:NTP transferase domain-containing protein [Leptolyngbya sp. SIO1D8]